MNLADRLRWILEHRTREDGRPWFATPLSLAAGLSRNHIGQILAGRVEAPDLATLERIAQVAGVSSAWLATGSGSPTDATVAPPAGQRLEVQRFAELPGWRDLLAGARARRPATPAWVWDRVARSFPLEGVPLTIGAVIHAADGILEQSTPPPRAR